MVHFEKLQKIISGNGFIAALDQSGGSTPKALLQYDVDQTYYKNDTEMYDQIHSMRARIVSPLTNEAFGDKESRLSSNSIIETADSDIDKEETTTADAPEVSPVTVLPIA